jgi:hypothetical protein
MKILLTIMLVLFAFPSCLIGACADLNNDNITDLKDVIIGLQILTNTQTINVLAPILDIDKDNKIGLPEVVYLTQLASTVRVDSGTVADDITLSISDSSTNPNTDGNSVLDSLDVNSAQLSGVIEGGGTLASVVVTDKSGNSSNVENIIVGSDGNWSAVADLSDLEDGTLTVTANATDPNGNPAAEVTSTIEKDTVADDITLSISDSSTNPNTDGNSVLDSLDVNSAQLSGVIEGGGTLASVVVTDKSGNSSNVENIIVGSDGNWSAVADLSDLEDGTLTVTANATDPNGNPAAEVTSTIEKDTVA